MRLVVLWAVLGVVLGSGGRSPSQPGRSAMPVGVSLARHDNVDTQHVFLDLFQRAGSFVMESSRPATATKERVWTADRTQLPPFHRNGMPFNFSQPNPASDTWLAVTAHLWQPLHDHRLPWDPSEGSIVLDPVAPPYDQGEQLVLLWRGSGHVLLTGDVSVAEPAVAMASGHMREVYNVTWLHRGLQLRILGSLNGDPVYDVHVVPFVHETHFWSSHPVPAFSPQMLALLQHVRPAVLRLVDWSGAYTQWQGFTPTYAAQFDTHRALPMHAFQGDWKQGIALEHAVRLCATIEAACWLAAPYNATVSYYHAMGRFVARKILANDVLAEQLAKRGGPSQTVDGVPALLFLEHSRHQGYGNWHGKLTMVMLDAIEAAVAEEEAEQARAPGSLRARLRFVLSTISYYYLPALFTSLSPTVHRFGK